MMKLGTFEYYADQAIEEFRAQKLSLLKSIPLNKLNKTFSHQPLIYVLAYLIFYRNISVNHKNIYPI